MIPPCSWRDARQEAGHVLEDHQGDVEGVAEAHEAPPLVGRVDVEHAGQDRRLVGDDPYRVTPQMREADEDVAGEARVDLVEVAVVHDAPDDVVHVVGAIGVVRYDLEEFLVLPVRRIGGLAPRRELGVVLRDEGEESPHGGQALGLGVVGEVGHAGPRGVHVRPAQALHVDVLVRHGLHDVGAGHEHVAGAAHHVDEVGDGGRVDRAPRARAEDHADLRDHAARQRVAQEDVRVAAQADHALLDARAAGVVQPHDRGPVLHGHVLELHDLLGVRLGERPAEHREVLAEHVDEAPVDRPVPGDHAVPQHLLVRQPEIRRAMRDEAIQLHEGVRVHEEVDPLARRQLAARVLRGDARLPAPLLRPAAELFQSLQLVVDGHARGSLSYPAGMRVPCSIWTMCVRRRTRPSTTEKVPVAPSRPRMRSIPARTSAGERAPFLVASRRRSAAS